MGYFVESMRSVHEGSEHERLEKVQGGDTTGSSVSTPGGTAHRDGMLPGTL